MSIVSYLLTARGHSTLTISLLCSISLEYPVKCCYFPDQFTFTKASTFLSALLAPAEVSSVVSMPPVLQPSCSKVDGLAFLGLSLQRKSENGHPASKTHQTAFDLDQVQDRDYKYIFSTDDNGWLVAGGEPGPPTSYKLGAADSAHVEIMRIGTYNKEWGGLSVDMIVKAMEAGEILIPQIEVLPTAVVPNGDVPPELEIRFDMQPAIPPSVDDSETPLPINWQLRFLHNQLFERFQFPSRFCPGAFHSTILRKAEFRSKKHEEDYFAKCEEAVKKWKETGPQALVQVDDGLNDDATEVKQVKCVKEAPSALAQEETDSEEGSKNEPDPVWSADHQSGIWLFTDRNNITHRFMPNFLPPYDTPLKRKLILQVLSREWHEPSLSWQPVG